MDTRIPAYNDKIYWSPSTQNSSLNDSLSLVKNVASQGQKISEQQLYAVLVHQQLSEKNPNLAQRFSQEFPALMNKYNSQGNKDSALNAVNALLQEFVKTKDLSSTDYQLIQKFCFGHAQLDDNRGSLSNVASGENSNLLEALIRAIFNTSATASELKDSDKTPATKAVQNAASQGQLVQSVSGSQDVGAPSNVFLWKPVSDSDGRLAVLLPSNLSSTAVGAQIVGPDGKVIEKGRFTGIGNGGRQHYRFSKAGGSYPDGSSVVITLRDGTTKSVVIKETGNRFEMKKSV